MGWAQAAGNDLMVSYVLMRKSNQASSLGDANRTLGLARAALRGQDRLSPRARALALRQQARGHALSGDATGCARALEAAREQAAAPEDQSEEDRILTGYCTPAFIEMEAADCAMLLDQPHQAVVTFQHGLATSQRSISGIEQSTWPDWRWRMRPAKSRNGPALWPKRPP